MRAKLKIAALALVGLAIAGGVALRIVAPPVEQPQGLIGVQVGVQVGPQVGPAVGVSAPSSGPLVVVFGDSNIVGQGNANNVSGVREFGVDTAFSPVTLAAIRAPNTNDPPSFSADTPVSLVAYSPGLQPGFGPEITLGRQLNEISSSYAYVVTAAITSSFLHTHWLPTASYMVGTTGKNLYNTEVARVHTYEASTGRAASLVIINLGTNDASDSTAANATTADMGTMVTALHNDFPAAKIVWPLVASATVQTFLSTVRTQQLAYASTAPVYFSMPNLDWTTLRDSFHWDDNGILGVGVQFAFAAADLAGVARRSVSTTPAIVGRGIAASGNAASLSPVSWFGTTDNDTELLECIASGLTPGGGAATQTISAPAGWTAITNGQTTAGGFTATWRVFSRAVGAGEMETTTVSPSKDMRAPAVTVNFANSTENYCQRFAIRGPNPHPTVDVSASTVFNLFDQGPHTIPALTTTASNEVVVYLVGGEGFSTGGTATLTAAGLANVAKFSETAHLMPDTGNLLVSEWSGGLAAAGSTGTASVSASLNTLWIVSAVAIKP